MKKNLDITIQKHHASGTITMLDGEVFRVDSPQFEDDLGYDITLSDLPGTKHTAYGKHKGVLSSWPFEIEAISRATISRHPRSATVRIVAWVSGPDEPTPL